MEGEGKKEIAEFVVFGPKALACIKLSTLDSATVSRCINIRMQRKRPGQKVARLRGYDGSELMQKCLRWVQDNRQRIETDRAEMPEAMGDREQDIYEPLFVLANLAGGAWPNIIKETALGLCGKSADAPQDSASLLLGWIKTYFDESRAEKVSSGELAKWLNERQDAPFTSWNNGKGIGQNEIRRLLGGFDIKPDTVRFGDKTAKGFKRDWFNDAFAAYLGDPPTETSNTVTTPANIEDSTPIAPVTGSACYRAESAIPTNKDGHCYGVTAPEAGNATRANQGQPATEYLVEELI